MTKKNRFYIFVISGVAFGLAACNTASTGTARIINEDESQLALLLNKNLSVTVVGLKDGMRSEPCELDTSVTPGTAAKADQKPPNDIPPKTKCKIDHGEEIFEKTYTVTFVKGTCCLYVDGDSSGTKYCNPPRSIQFVEKTTGKTCGMGK